MKVKDAAYEAGVARFRPILLTSITTVAGLYPLVLETDRQAQFLIPMAITVVYGVLFGTLFILFFLPSILMALNEFRRFLYRFWEGESIEAELIEPTVREKIRQQEHNSFFQEVQEAILGANRFAEEDAARNGGNGHTHHSNDPQTEPS